LYIKIDNPGGFSIKSVVVVQFCKNHNIVLFF
jgi:hypothetical protein